MLKFFNVSRTLIHLSRKKQSIRNVILCGALTLTINSVYAMVQEEENGTYVLQTGPKGAERLDLQDKFLSGSTEEHLKIAGLSVGQTVYDLGCGSGATTIDLAKTVGPTGRVYAIDKSAKQLDVAKGKVIASGFENVEFIQGDVTSINTLPTQNADLVYIRFVLMHVQKPESVVKLAKTLLKPGGVVVSQEPIMSSSIYKDLDGYKETLAALARKLGVEYDIGDRLEKLYKDVGFETSVKYIRPTMTATQAKILHTFSLSEWKEGAIKAGILTQTKVNEWEQLINKWSGEGGTESFYNPPVNAYIIAKKL